MTTPNALPIHPYIDVYARLDSRDNQLFQFTYMTMKAAEQAAHKMIVEEFLSMPGNEDIDPDSLEVYTELIVGSASPIDHYD